MPWFISVQGYLRFSDKILKTAFLTFISNIFYLLIKPYKTNSSSQSLGFKLRFDTKFDIESNERPTLFWSMFEYFTNMVISEG